MKKYELKIILDNGHTHTETVEADGMSFSSNGNYVSFYKVDSMVRNNVFKVAYGRNMIVTEIK